MFKGKVAVVSGSTSGIGLGIADELANLVERDFAQPGNRAQDSQVTLLFKTGKLGVDIDFHPGSAHGFLLGLLCGQIALDDIAEIIGRGVVRRDVGSVDGYCENRGREQKER